MRDVESMFESAGFLSRVSKRKGTGCHATPSEDTAGISWSVLSPRRSQANRRVLLAAALALALGVTHAISADCPPGEKCTPTREVAAESVVLEETGNELKVTGVIQIMESGDLASLHVSIVHARNGVTLAVIVDETLTPHSNQVLCPTNCVGGCGGFCGWATAGQSGTCEKDACCVDRDFWGNLYCSGYSCYCHVYQLATGFVLQSEVASGDTFTLSITPDPGFPDGDGSNNTFTATYLAAQ